jgi:hypothetical protein
MTLASCAGIAAYTERLWQRALSLPAGSFGSFFVQAKKEQYNAEK